MQSESFIPGKDASLDSSLNAMPGKLDALGFHAEERPWLDPVDAPLRLEEAIHAAGQDRYSAEFTQLGVYAKLHRSRAPA